MGPASVRPCVREVGAKASRAPLLACARTRWMLAPLPAAGPASPERSHRSRRVSTRYQASQFAEWTLTAACGPDGDAAFFCWARSWTAAFFEAVGRKSQRIRLVSCRSGSFMVSTRWRTVNRGKMLKMLSENQCGETQFVTQK